MTLAHDLADTVARLLAGVGKVVHDGHGVAALEQLDAGVRADEAGTAGDQHAAVLDGIAQCSS